MNISQHISTLLQLHECVVIPDFGAFISNYVPAAFNEHTNSYCPPTKEIVFNSKIVKNDGILINYLVEVESIGYQQARSAIQMFCDQSVAKLNQGESVHFKQLGSIQFDKFGTYQFTAEKVNFLTDAYGLKEFQPQKIENYEKTKLYISRPAVRAMQGRYNGLKIAASIALLLSLSLLPMRSAKQIDTSNVNPIWSIITDDAIVPDKAAQQEVNASEIKIEESSKPYILVGGSFSVLQNAEKYRDQLLASGHHPEVYQKEDGNFRVVVDSYDDWNLALESMAQFRDDHPGSKVWVSKR